MREVQTIVIVAISEVVNVIANHGVLAIVHSAHSGPFTSASEVSLESRSPGVAAGKHISVIGPGVPEPLLEGISLEICSIGEYFKGKAAWWCANISHLMKLNMSN